MWGEVKAFLGCYLQIIVGCLILPLVVLIAIFTLLLYGAQYFERQERVKEWQIMIPTETHRALMFATTVAQNEARSATSTAVAVASRVLPREWDTLVEENLSDVTHRFYELPDYMTVYGVSVKLRNSAEIPVELVIIDDQKKTGLFIVIHEWALELDNNQLLIGVSHTLAQPFITQRGQFANSGKYQYYRHETLLPKTCVTTQQIAQYQANGKLLIPISRLNYDLVMKMVESIDRHWYVIHSEEYQSSIYLNYAWDTENKIPDHIYPINITDDHLFGYRIVVRGFLNLTEGTLLEALPAGIGCETQYVISGEGWSNSRYSHRMNVVEPDSEFLGSEVRVIDKRAFDGK